MQRDTEYDWQALIVRLQQFGLTVENVMIAVTEFQKKEAEDVREQQSETVA